jgi:hypothetical protein
MESKMKFIQNRTVFLSFASSANTSAVINVPFEVDRVIFRSLAHNGATVSLYGVITSDLIGWNAIGVVQRDSTYSNSTAQTIEYHFQTPTKIQGRYNFRMQNLTEADATVSTTESVVFIAEFIRGHEGHN